MYETYELTILLTHAIATLLMTGVIWFVQIVHYPLMQHVGEAQFAAYARRHQNRTTWVVAPLMLVEIASAFIVAVGPDSMRGSDFLGWFSFGLVVVCWCSTALIQVPQHKRLLSGFDGDVLRALVIWNWIRTVCWSVRVILAIYFLIQHPGRLLALRGL